MPLAWLNEDVVLWSAAALSFLLLVGMPWVTAALTSRRRGAATRAAKVFLILVILCVVVAPLLVLLTATAVDGRPCGLYLLFFSLFCYYSGKRFGTERGRRNVEERLDLSSFDSDIEVTDRLLESRLRYPRPEDVVTSIKELSATRPGAAGGVAEEIADRTVAEVTGAVSPSQEKHSVSLHVSAVEQDDAESDDEVEVFEVEVEEISKGQSRSSN
ncbi:MAG: hypothetical protein LIQ31_12865 [Planctomycetes bacterium]|nr:hypothetical protein [Planctomycetota bacterium]